MSRHLPWIRSLPQPNRNHRAEVQLLLNSTALKSGVLLLNLMALEWGVPPHTTYQHSLPYTVLHLLRNVGQSDSSEQHHTRSRPSSRLQFVLALALELEPELEPDLVKAQELESCSDSSLCLPVPVYSCLELEPEQGLVPAPMYSCLELELAESA